MVLVSITLRVVDVTEVYTRYVTVTFQSITDDYNTWPDRKILTPYHGQELVWQKDLSEGTYPVYFAVTNFVEDWRITVIIKDYATGKELFKVENYLKSKGFPFAVNLGTLRVGAPSPPQKLLLKVTSTVGGDVEVRYISDGTERTATVYQGTTENYYVDNGSFVYFIAKPRTGYAFDRYDIDTRKIYDIIHGFTVSKDVWVVASFRSVSPPPSNYYNLTYNVGDGGKLYINNVEYEKSGTLTYVSGTSLSLKAVPQSGYEIERFTVDGTAIVGTDTYNTTINRNISVSLSFKKTEAKSTPGLGYDPSEIFNQMRDNFINPMMTMMIGMTMMMAMMQMMTGMISAMGAGFV